MQKINIEGEKKMVGTGIRDSSIVWRWRGKKRERRRKEEKKKKIGKKISSPIFFSRHERSVSQFPSISTKVRKKGEEREIYIYIYFNDIVGGEEGEGN